MEILRLLESAEQHHMSAEEIYQTLLKMGVDISFATVYRVLTQFEDAGIVIRHHFASGQAIFELDPGDNHNHIVCIKSGRVEEFTDVNIENRLQKIAHELGYRVTEDRIVIYGIHRQVRDEDIKRTPTPWRSRGG